MPSFSRSMRASLWTICPRDVQEAEAVGDPCELLAAEHPLRRRRDRREADDHVLFEHLVDRGEGHVVDVTKPARHVRVVDVDITTEVAEELQQPPADDSAADHADRAPS